MADRLPALARPHRGPVLPALERLAPPPRDDVLAAEIEARTAPGDIVIELHGRGAWVARSALNRLRRVYDVESIALTRLQAELVLRPPDLRHLDAAVNALATQPRRDVPLRDSLLGAFTSRCATCGGPVTVEEYLWEGEGDAPTHKSYRCERCADRRGALLRTSEVDATDERDARDMGRRNPVGREILRARFPAPEGGHTLPGQLLDLYTPRTVDAIAALTERIDADLRAPSIQASLRLALVHLLLPASRLQRTSGRPAVLRVAGGRLRVPPDRGWRERNPWLLFEEGIRHIRGFIQRIEGAPTGAIQARLGSDLAALVDGAANVVLTEGSAAVPGIGPRLPRDRQPLPGRLDPRSRIRLVLSQPPLHWSPENLAFAYLATSVALGREAAEGLPLEAIYGAPAGSEWAWDVATLRRSLVAVRPVLAPDARVVVVLDRGGPGALAAGVLGGVGAGLRLSEAVLAEAGDDIGGTLEFTLDDGDAASEERPATSGGERPTAGSVAFALASVESDVTEVAVEVLQARGEPARGERLLGEVLIGLDQRGHLRRLVGTRTFAETEERAERTAQALGLFGEPPVTAAAEGRANGSGPRLPTVRETAHDPRATRSVPPALQAPDSEGSREPDATMEGHGTESVGSPPGGDAPAGATDAVRPERSATPDTSAAPDVSTAPEAPPSSGALPTTETSLSARLEERERDGSGADPVRLLLEIVMGELRRPDHPRLQELEPGRWWLRDPKDIAAANLPLSDRVEWAIFSLLSTSGGLSEDAFYGRLGRMFRGHDTPDEELLRACLESYRLPDGPQDVLRTGDQLQSRYEEHGGLVGMLAEYGHRLGLRVWIARREQKRTFKGCSLASMLSEAEQRVYLPLVTPGEAEALEAVDCIWYVRGKAAFLFEVEWTAMLGEPVMRRGSRIPPGEQLVRFLVVPPERTELVRLKLARSPLLRQRMEEDNWHILKADHVRRLWARESADLDDLGPLLGLDPEIERQGEQLALFG